MKFLFSISLITLLSGCAANQGGNGDFYTWVDANGQLHTVKKAASPTQSKKESSPREKSSQTDFDASDFTPSTEMDKRLQGGRLYAWNDGQGQRVVEQIPGVDYEPIVEVKGPSPKPFKSISFREYREGKEISLSDHYNRVISLERFYSYNDKTKKDYILFEVDFDHGNEIEFKSFISKSKVALPTVVFLNSDYESVSAQLLPFNDYSEETWSSYAHLHGRMYWPNDAVYLLLTPTDEVGVVEIEDQVIKMLDLGQILIK